jgi:hypothetical protein
MREPARPANLLASFGITGRRVSPDESTSFVGVADPARSREVGVATEMLLTNAEQVSDNGRAPLDYASRSHRERAAALLDDEKRGKAGGRLHS